MWAVQSWDSSAPPVSRGPAFSAAAFWTAPGESARAPVAASGASLESSSSSARTTRRPSRGSTSRAATRSAPGQLGVQCRRAPDRQLRLAALPHPAAGARAQVQVGQGGAQVEARPPHHDRPAPGGQQHVDLRVGALSVLAGAEAAVDRDECDQPMLELLALGGRWRLRSASPGPRRPAARRPTPRPGPPRCGADGPRARPPPRSCPRRWARTERRWPAGARAQYGRRVSHPARPRSRRRPGGGRP